MKKTNLAVLSAVAVTLFTLSSQHESQAAPAPMNPGTTAPRPAPRPEIQLPPSIAGVAFLGGAATKPNADLKTFALEVPIRGAGSAPRAGTLHVTRGTTTFLNAPFTVTGTETKTIPVADSIGMAEACTRADYDLHIEGSGFDTHKKARVTASCTFTSANVNPWNLMTPDRVEDHKKNHVYFSDAQVLYHLPVAPGTPQISPQMLNACGSHVVVKTNVTNRLNHAVTGIRVGISLNGAWKDTTFTDLAAGQTKEVTVDFTFRGEAGRYDVKLEDTNNSAGGQVDSPGFHFDIGRSCSLSAALVP